MKRAIVLAMGISLALSTAVLIQKASANEKDGARKEAFEKIKKERIAFEKQLRQKRWDFEDKKIAEERTFQDEMKKERRAAELKKETEMENQAEGPGSRDSMRASHKELQKAFEKKRDDFRKKQEEERKAFHESQEAERKAFRDKMEASREKMRNEMKPEHKK